MAEIILKPGREKSLLRRHPWIFSGAIRQDDPAIAPGSTVDLYSSDHCFLARASYSPKSQIRARVWTFEDEVVDQAFFQRRIDAAIASRSVVAPSPSARLANGDRRAIRIVYAESDGLPGLIVDRYGDVLVMQSLTAGSEYWKDTIAEVLIEKTGLSTLYERSDSEVRELEGLGPKKGMLRGELQSVVIPIIENNLRFQINLAEGHKSGFYLDQRRNRLRVRELARDKEVLDCFCYTGGFSVNALAGGAKSVLCVDSSFSALSLCKEHVALNQLPMDRHGALEGDVFQCLRKFRDEKRCFDLIILDPPKFAPTAALAAKAARAYKDINLLAFKLLRRNGILVTFSCSGGVDAALFQKIVAGSALDAGVEAQIVEFLSQDFDHPVALNFPEGAYLKGLVCLRN
ncbi:MAG: class I SAM-dependent rRNA methyltransferase [Methylococcales bacterium]